MKRGKEDAGQLERIDSALSKPHKERTPLDLETIAEFLCSREIADRLASVAGSGYWKGAGTKATEDDVLDCWQHFLSEKLDRVLVRFNAGFGGGSGGVRGRFLAYLAKALHRSSRDYGRLMLRQAGLKRPGESRAATTVDGGLERVADQRADPFNRTLVRELLSTRHPRTGVRVDRLLRDFYIEGASVAEIAERRGKTPGAIKQELRRTREVIRDLERRFADKGDDLL